MTLNRKSAQHIMDMLNNNNILCDVRCLILCIFMVCDKCLVNHMYSSYHSFMHTH